MSRERELKFFLCRDGVKKEDREEACGDEKDDALVWGPVWIGQVNLFFKAGLRCSPHASHQNVYRTCWCYEGMES
jgi:hypothetical protein